MGEQARALTADSGPGAVGGTEDLGEAQGGTLLAGQGEVRGPALRAVDALVARAAETGARAPVAVSVDSGGAVEASPDEGPHHGGTALPRVGLGSPEARVDSRGQAVRQGRVEGPLGEARGVGSEDAVVGEGLPRQQDPEGCRLEDQQGQRRQESPSSAHSESVAGELGAIEDSRRKS